MKTNHVIYGRDVQWLGKMWHKFYNIPSSDSTDTYVDLYDDYIEKTCTHQEVENNAQGTEQMLVEAEETSIEEEEPFAARTGRTGSQEDLTNIASFAHVKTGSNLHEWLNKIAFVTSEMSDPSEPQTSEQAWWHPDLEAREKWCYGIKLEFNKMISIGVWRNVRLTKHSKWKEVGWMPLGIKN